MNKKTVVLETERLTLRKLTMEDAEEVFKNWASDDDGRVEFGYNISKKHWRNGYTTEALKAVFGFLSKDLGIKKFRCCHAKLNPASGAVMSKIGFKYVKDVYLEKFDKSEGFEVKVYYLDVE